MECLLKTSSLAGPRAVGAGDSETDTDGCNPGGGGGGNLLRWAAAIPALWVDRVGVPGMGVGVIHGLPANVFLK